MERRVLLAKWQTDESARRSPNPNPNPNPDQVGPPAGAAGAPGARHRAPRGVHAAGARPAAVGG
eukprot:scaffold102502_cov45-Phaeocystis_antarctica.AAC.1